MAPSDESGSVTLAGGALLVVALLVVTLTLEVGAYLVTASRAQTAADAAALAAASAPTIGRAPTAAARRLTVANGGRLDGLDLDGAVVTVRVSLPVHALLVTRFAPRRVTAEAAATLVPPPA